MVPLISDNSQSDPPILLSRLVFVGSSPLYFDSAILFHLDDEVAVLGVDAGVVLGPLARGLRASVAGHGDGELVVLKGFHVVEVVARRLG